MGFGGPRRLLGHPLSNSMERANPSIFTAGPPSKDGCQMLHSSAKKTNKGTFKNSRVKEGFFFFFSSLLHKLSSLAVNDLFPFITEVQAPGNCHFCRFQESLPLSPSVAVSHLCRLEQALEFSQLISLQMLQVPSFLP